MTAYYVVSEPLIMRHYAENIVTYVLHSGDFNLKVIRYQAENLSLIYVNMGKIVAAYTAICGNPSFYPQSAGSYYISLYGGIVMPMR